VNESLWQMPQAGRRLRTCPAAGWGNLALDQLDRATGLGHLHDLHPGHG
jgi:hypothetical protein